MRYLVWSIEHEAWWRYSRFGYTRLLSEAGRFSDAESAAIVADANVVCVNECRIPAECVEAKVGSPDPENLPKSENPAGRPAGTPTKP
jgi:hypothetical protein